MEVNLLAILAASVAQFAFGAVWYMPLFGKLWGDMHDFDKVPKAKQEQMKAEMGPYYGLQFLVTVLTTFVLAKFILLLPDYSGYVLAFWLWAGFVVPVEVSSVIFGGTESKWIAKKIAVTSFGALGCLLLAVAVLNFF